MVRGEAPLDLGAGLVGIAVGLAAALAPVVPLPLDLGAVELLGVVAAGQLGREEDVDRRKRETGRDPQLQRRLLALLGIVGLLVVGKSQGCETERECDDDGDPGHGDLPAGPGP